MKRCSRCGHTKSLSEFHGQRAAASGRQGWCKACERARRIALKARVLAYLAEHPCVDCGESDPVVLDFDHVVGVKEQRISVMVRDARPWDVIEQEIAKCEVRCSNCHRKRHAREGYPNRATSTDDVTLPEPIDAQYRLF